MDLTEVANIRSGKNTQNYTKKVLVIQIITVL